MMRWGRRKSPSASSSKSSFISHVSPFSWLSKFKQMRIDSKTNHGKLKQKVMQNSSQPVCSPYKHPCGNVGRFYDGDDGDDDDDDDNGTYWRLSFSEKNRGGKRIKNTVKSEKWELDDEHTMPSGSYRSGRWNAKKHGKRHGNLKFKEKDNGFREERKLSNDMKSSEEMDEYNREKDLQNLRRRFQMKAQRVLQEQIMKLEREAEEADEFASKSVKEDMLQIESPATIRTPRTHSFSTCVDSRSYGRRASREDPLLCKERFVEENLSFECKKLKQIEHEELRLKPNTEKQRKSVHVSREIQRRWPKHSTKVRVYSPRTASKVEICKIKALEDMKKAKLKMKKAKEKEKIVEETVGLDSFAVVKCSFNPQKDFRDSMVEMIREKQINQPEEMEELLASYLTLNSDEYHDLIVKVFRQVWLDMRQDSLGINLDEDSCFYD